ncbi:hypothetical protein TruAng_006275 [Truncatella angustata]|nr:hypothetical protein TruAng_006275 [Truncatella angustata]
MHSSRRRKRETFERLASDQQQPARKKTRSSELDANNSLGIKHAVLSQYYIKVLTLRDYVLLKLPATSRIRRKKLASVGLENSTTAVVPTIEKTVGALLDNTLVGLTEQSNHASENRWEQWTSFTQRGDESYITLSDGLAGAAFSQSEVVDFVIWQLWSRVKTSSPTDRPQHVLCDGFRYPLNNAKPITATTRPKDPNGNEKALSEIIFVRNRMLYARATLNARGLVHFGLRHIHVLNRAPYTQIEAQSDAHLGRDDPIVAQNLANTRKVMMYMFPRQFGLHNVFTSKVDFAHTAQRLQDYTLREQEIAKKHYCPVEASSELNSASQPIRNKSKKATEDSATLGTQLPRKKQSFSIPSKANQACSITSMATQSANVSAFCQAVVLKVVPRDLFGHEGTQKHNQDMLFRRIDQFIRLRRFESMSLHEITDIEWLASSKLLARRTSQSDIQKRTELFCEFLYYVFDSLLIPLLRSNFYITESNTDKNQLFFFRHDVWRCVAEPAISTLKLKMFEEINLGDATRILDSRELGFSHVRLLPKGASIRPIMNLRKRVIKDVNKKELGKSINTLLRPIHTILQLEKALNPGKLSSAMFSVGDIYQRVKSFKSRLGSFSGQLYFAKVDVQSAFDTIPQSAIVGLLDSIPQRYGYQIAKHVEISNSTLDGPKYHNSRTKPRKQLRKWLSTAMEHNDMSSLLHFIENDRALKKRNTVFIESVMKQNYDTGSVLQLIASHIQENIVKIGKKYYRQKKGIPQGSVLSSTLCNYFYADLEIQVLKFLHSDDCLLIRLIDDFLLVTTDQIKASCFVSTMHDGVPEYGVTVNPTKTLVNFNLTICGKAIARTATERTGFPYCGTLINTSSLDITRDRRDRSTIAGGSGKPVSVPGESVFNSLTVEYTRVPGQTFQRKVLNAFKIQSHLMYLDTSFNSASTMLSNLYSAFVETATKTWAYVRCLPPPKRPAAGLVTRTVEKLADVAFLLSTSKGRKTSVCGGVGEEAEQSWGRVGMVKGRAPEAGFSHRCPERKSWPFPSSPGLSQGEE